MAQITIVLNEEKNGIEIRFPGIPPAGTRDRLKAAGWRWSRFNGCWYAKDTPGNRKFAESFAPIGKPETQAEAEARSVNDYIAAQEAAYWDKFTM
jgi:hypothetical protein